MTTTTTTDPGSGSRRRRSLVIAGVVWLVLGIGLSLLGGGVGGFTPDDPEVPTIGFFDAGDGRVGIDVGPVALRDATGVEVRTGSEAQSGRVLWKVRRTDDTTPTDGRVVLGETPEGFAVDQALEAGFPSLWHVEVDNACFYASAVTPVGLRSDVLTIENGDRLALDAFDADGAGFSPCGSGTLRDRAGLFAGLVAFAIGGVLLLVAWFDFRRKLPAELSTELDGRTGDAGDGPDPIS